MARVIVIADAVAAKDSGLDAGRLELTTAGRRGCGTQLAGG